MLLSTCSNRVLHCFTFHKQFRGIKLSSYAPIAIFFFPKILIFIAGGERPGPSGRAETPNTRTKVQFKFLINIYNIILLSIWHAWNTTKNQTIHFIINLNNISDISILYTIPPRTSITTDYHTSDDLLLCTDYRLYYDLRCLNYIGISHSKTLFSTYLWWLFTFGWIRIIKSTKLSGCFSLLLLLLLL